MYSNNGLQRYREADIHSMTKEKMIVLLYEKVESNLESAKIANDNGDVATMTRLVNHSQRIVCELRGALDHSIGGEISLNLEALYDFLFHEHLQVIIDRDNTHFENCIRVLHPLLESWRSIPPGSYEKAARDHSMGMLQNQPAGPEPATSQAEAREDEAPVVETSTEAPSEAMRTLSLSV
jgi:flagellar secretion chaperone FliS